ncbi:MAG: Peptide chain release factor 2 [candidate division WS2 bacterium ADurb.Bin280]|uniref:Peptide chain release factor 2 n=1 Tax=candidate division WS2 bacterium ADurb.Bin280 TaxID=1852829 RepID=A0A1V5SDH7_9BACT|nr:MAG: Peptide chain release factor 2 [candidate division WS2 bacterium ADurb.Bin280]
MEIVDILLKTGVFRYNPGMEKSELNKILKIDEKRQEIAKINKQMSDPAFWNDQERSKNLSQKLSSLNSIIEKFDSASTDEQIGELEKEALYADEYDSLDCILSIHAGAGGTEAQDWALMLERMFLRFAEKKNYSATILDQSDGEEAGIKSATIKISGHNAYGNLKSESGVHRLVRISPFDADKARHTSFALVEVIPEFEELGDVEINEKDLKIDVFRASGHGGQSVNTTDSAVRLTHLPTKITVSVQNERSQIQNRETAMKILKARIKKIQIEEQKKKEDEIKGGRISAEWGNQIRSYVLQPYQQVKDHRTEYVENNPQLVLDGNLEGFVEGYLKKLNS